MGYINIKITDIEIPNDFRVYYKPDGGSGKPYPVDGSTWTDYGELVDMPIYSGGTTTIMLSGSTVDFEYGTTYWVKLVESDYPDRYVIKNIRIFDSIAYEGAVPSPSPTSVLASPSRTPSITRTPSLTRTPSITPTNTPSISMSSSSGAVPPTPSPSEGISEVYFASLSSEIATMGVNNSNGRTFEITFYYHLNANCDNVWSNGADPVQATTYFFVSTNNGLTWDEAAYVTAEISGGNSPIDQSDNQNIYGTYTITGITDVSQVKILGSYDCAWTTNSQSGTINVWITGVTVNTGSAIIVCDDKYYTGCLATPALSCEGVAASPTPTPSITPTISRTPSVTPEIIEISIFNEGQDGINIGNGEGETDNNVTVNGVKVIPWGGSAFPLFPTDDTIVRSPVGTGSYSVGIYLYGSNDYPKYIKITDSNSYVHCEAIPAFSESIEIVFTGVYLSTAGASILLEPGTCPPLPSPTPSRTPSITQSISLTATPGLSPSRTPSVTPTVFGYYVDIYTCSGISCGSNIGTGYIENAYYLTVNDWYKSSESIVYRISATAPLGGDLTYIEGPGYSSCDDACASSLY